MSVFGASISASATSSVDNAIKAELIVTSTNSGPGSFSRSLADKLAALPGVTASLIVYGGQFEVGQSVETLKGVSTAGLSQTVNLRLTAGSISALNQVRPRLGRRQTACEVRPYRGFNHADRRDI
jgi:hypothetical protein